MTADITLLYDTPTPRVFELGQTYDVRSSFGQRKLQVVGIIRVPGPDRPRVVIEMDDVA